MDMINIRGDETFSGLFFSPLSVAELPILLIDMIVMIALFFTAPVINCIHLANFLTGPRRVNHASVSIGEYIYSFGGYCSFENYRVSRPIDIHVLNTNTLRWSLMPMKDQKYPQVPFQRYGK